MGAKELNDVGLNLKRINRIVDDIPNEQSLANKIKHFVLTAIVALTAAALLTVPWFHAIFFVASMFIVASSFKVGGFLGVYGVLAKKALVFSLPGSKDLLLEPTVRDKAKIFTQTGQTFFDHHRKTLQDEHKDEHKKEEPEPDINSDLERDGNEKPDVI